MIDLDILIRDLASADADNCPFYTAICRKQIDEMIAEIQRLRENVSMADLDELERLEKAATPDWFAANSERGFSIRGACGPTGSMTVANFNFAEFDKVNRDFVLAMRNALPALLECARACEFYADESNYERGKCTFESSFEQYEPSTYEAPKIDNGQRARAALAKLRQ